tara:strand:- start:978 stop:1391 length:414 start_codon:yes stop_codon:yes gene_type:complete
MPKVKLFPSDVAWSKYIRTRDNWTCQRCSKQYVPPTNALHCSHYWSRGAWTVRFDEDNTMALCYGCHSYLGGNPQEHREFVLARLGQRKYDALQQRRNKSLKSGEKKYLNSKEFKKEIQLMTDNLLIKKSEDYLDED